MVYALDSKSSVDIVELARQLLADERLTIKNVKEKVAQASGVPIGKLMHKRRIEGRIPHLMSLVYFVYEERFGLNDAWIKRLTGRSDHTTIRYGSAVVRDLIEAYNRTSAQPILLNRRKPSYCPYSVQLVENLMRDPEVNPESLEHRICLETGIEPHELNGDSRDYAVVHVRQVRDYVWKNHRQCGLNYLKIGTRTGRHHTTVAHGVAKIQEYVRARTNK